MERIESDAPPHRPRVTDAYEEEEETLSNLAAIVPLLERIAASLDRIERRLGPADGGPAEPR